MDLKRFFASSIAGEKAIISGDEFTHCVKVTRHKIGFLIVIPSSEGYDYLAEITEIHADRLVATIKEKQENKTEPKGKIVLFQGLCKEFDFIVQKAVELGATEIRPFLSLRTNITDMNMDRMKKIVAEAAKQCGRAKLPALFPAVRFEEAVKECQDIKNRILCYEECKSRTTVAEAIESGSIDAALYIGSEGGFTAEEVTLSQENGIKTVTLGRRILRAETAAVAALTLTASALGEL